MSGQAGVVDDGTLQLGTRSDLSGLAAVVATSGASVIALVGEVGSNRTAADAADLASALGASGRRTILASLESGRCRLDVHLRADGRPGFTDVLAGEARLPDIALLGRAPGVIYLPSGSSRWPLQRVIKSTDFRRLASQIRDRGALLLLYVTELEPLTGPKASIALDGIVMIDALVSAPAELPIPVLEVPSTSGESVSGAFPNASDSEVSESGCPSGKRPDDAAPAAEPVILVRRHSRGRRRRSAHRSGFVGGIFFLLLILSAALAWLGAEVAFGRDPIEMLLQGLNPAGRVDGADRGDLVGRGL